VTAVLGVDLGTSSAKAVAFDTRGVALAAHAVEVPIDAPSPGRAEQDPHRLVAAAAEAITAVREQMGGLPLAGIGLSGAMHSLLALDAHGNPLTPAVLFADNRAAVQASALRAMPGAIELARRTGTPIHPMSPLAKLRWFAEEDPAIAARARWWISAKEYLLRRMTGARVVDHSTASATGLFNLATRDWDAHALALAHVGRGQLFDPVVTTTVLPSIAAVGVPARTPVVAGATDGCLATLGAGAVGEGSGALTIGTSGALRAMVDTPEPDERARLFCYALTEGRWVAGGPISSGGIVLRWARDQLFPGLGPRAYARFDELAAAVPPGADGLVCLPYLLGERAPLWDPSLCGAFVGLTIRHGQGHLLRALLEGVAFQLATVLELVDGLRRPLVSLKADGGFTRSPLWPQIVADVLNRPLELPRVTEGACRGAALLALQALGLGDAFALAEATPIVRVVQPDRQTAEHYRAALQRFVTLRDQLWETGDVP